jgi:single-stranded DNA-binding protein
MIDALIAGRLYGKPQARMSKSGNAFAIAKVRATMSDGGTAFVSVIAFSHSAQAALLALDEGDSVAISGQLRVGTYLGADGTARPSLDLTASAVMTTYHVQRKRKATAAPCVPVLDRARAEEDLW